MVRFREDVILQIVSEWTRLWPGGIGSNKKACKSAKGEQDGTARAFGSAAKEQNRETTWQNESFRGVYIDRTAGGYRNHRNPGGDAVARAEQGARQGQDRALCVQPETNRYRHWPVLRRL